MTDYTPPGIRNVTDIDTPSVSAILDRPTVMALVSPARGHQEIQQSEILVDNIPVVLEGFQVTTSPISTINVVDAIDKNLTYSEGSDYVVSTDPATGKTSIARKIYTQIPYSEQVVILVKTVGGSPSGALYTQEFNLTGNVAGPIQQGGFVGIEATNSGTISLGNTTLQRTGVFSQVVNPSSPATTDVEISYTETTCTIERSSTSSIVSGQKVYVSYTTSPDPEDSTAVNYYLNEEVTLTGTTAFNLDNEAEGVNVSSIVIKNTLETVSRYATTFSSSDIGDNSPTTDCLININTGSNSVSVVRNTTGPTTMNNASNRIQVLVSYQYITPNYYYPTEMTSLSDVEAKYGPAFDEYGDISSPMTFAAAMAFSNGANEIWCQALFTETTAGGITSRIPGDVTDTNDWDKSLAALRTTDVVNVIVPIVTDSEGITDDVQLGIFQQVVSHINNLHMDGEYAIGIFGEDATRQTAIGKAQPGTLREHSISLSGSAHPERNVLVSPASFAFANPRKSGSLDNIGGQYVAAAIAGMLGARSIQTPLTRKTVANIAKTNVSRSESEKNGDAGSGLLVIENKNGALRIRHAITTQINNVYMRELSAVRAKFFMIESVRKTIDTQIIGQVIADARSPFIVTSTVQGVLELLKASGALVDYANVSAKAIPNQPTAVEVRWSYALPYPLNYVDIVMSLDTATGAVTVQ